MVNEKNCAKGPFGSKLVSIFAIANNETPEEILRCFEVSEVLLQHCKTGACKITCVARVFLLAIAGIFVCN